MSRESLPYFDGKEPNSESFAPVAKMLHEKNFSFRFYTDYGRFEVQNPSDVQNVELEARRTVSGNGVTRGNSFR